MTVRISLVIRCLVCPVLLLGSAAYGGAQAVPAATHGAEVVTSQDSDVPEPARVGWSLSDGTTATHDTSSGWSFTDNPALGYRLNRAVSFDASIPYYLYVNAVKTGQKGNPKLVGHDNVLGDAALAGHVSFSPGGFGDASTLSFSAPTGDEHLGVGTGHVGYNLSNHLERSIGPVTPDVEVGIGNTSSLVRRRTAKAYTSSGRLLFLQSGTNIDLPAAFAVDAEAYEQLPIGAQTVYSRASRKKGAVLTQASDAEDNGVTFEVDAPAMRRLLLTANVSHSIRLNDTTTGVTLEWLLHVPGAR